jgi:Tfp pilus assembly protein PilF
MNRFLRIRCGLCILASTVSLAGCTSGQLAPSRPVVTLSGGKIAAEGAGAASAEDLVAEGRALEERGEFGPAIEALERAVKLDPRQAEACWRLAVSYDKLGRWSESSAYYQKALQAKPGNADLYADMGYSLYLQRRWPEAEMNLRQALALQNDNRRAHVNLGLLLARTDRVEEAVVEFRTAHCDVADAHVNVAYALGLDRHWEQARSHYQRALAADSSSDAARKGLHEVQVHAGKRGEVPADQQIELTSATDEEADAGAVEATLPPRKPASGR